MRQGGCREAKPPDQGTEKDKNLFLAASVSPCLITISIPKIIFLHDILYLNTVVLLMDLIIKKRI